MAAREIDEEAVRTPKMSGLPLCLYVPIGARDQAAIERYVGRIARIVEGGDTNRAFLVEAYDPPQRDVRLPIWQLAEARIFHAPYQMWVHVDLKSYRRAYT
jgi:hypothetical protein